MYILFLSCDVGSKYLQLPFYKLSHVKLKMLTGQSSKIHSEKIVLNILLNYSEFI